MLLKLLKVLNFRQFKGEQLIHFATENVKNVTVIMGENGSGKTTLAQAFTWCLYGDTDFEDKSVLNRIVDLQMLPNSERRVRVDLELVHNGIDYTITREQIYKKELSGKAKARGTNFYISYKKGGQQEFLKSIETEVRMKEILPKELSRYFFFDGERIGNMSKEIKKGRSQEFAQAVKSLLGLNAFIAALDHLKPTSKYSVIGSYNESYDYTSDTRIEQYTKEIEKAQEELDKIEARLEEIEKEIQLASEKCDALTAKLKTLEESERLQKEKEKHENNLMKAKDIKISAMASLLKHFNSYASSYFAKSLIKDALENLSKADKLDKGIPDITARTIEFLIKRGFCLCNREIKVGNEAYNELNKVLNYIPPQSIGSSIGQFVKESELRVKSAEHFFDNISQHYSFIREQEEQIGEYTKLINTIEQQLANRESTSHIQKQLWHCEQIISDRQKERDEKNQLKGSIQTSRDRAITQRAELTLRDEKNKKIEIYRAYAQYMYDEIMRVYKRNEDETRKRLEQIVNEIFKSIYEGGMGLTIDEKYNIQVIVDDQGGYATDVETSLAQSISVIFAFISGVIKMARDNSSDSEPERKFLESEPYPLVMDAPLSAFDKRRIKTVCEVLPNIAEQVIIFIKDTDGELAEEHMASKVGKRYIFDKKNEFETYIMPR